MQVSNFLKGIVLFGFLSGCQSTKIDTRNNAFELISDSLVNIPAGSFVMGCSGEDTECDDSEKPSHERTIFPFKMMRQEVTWEMYIPCIKAGACDDIRIKGFKYQLNHPVTFISWNDVTEQFIPWLNKNQKSHYRLPSEAEWEYAARARTFSKYSWGDKPNGQFANGSNKHGWPEDGYNEISPVMSFNPNDFGLYDMHGNLWEWVQDCWNENEYQNTLSSGKANEDRGEKYESTGICKRRVARGGAYGYKPHFLRSSTRYYLYANSRFMVMGFRLVHE